MIKGKIMRFCNGICLTALILLMFSLLAYTLERSSDEKELSRREFPSDFLFGVSSSAYQYEGGYMDDGKGLSNWDVFTHITGTITDGQNGDVAGDSYHLYNLCTIFELMYLYKCILQSSLEGMATSDPSLVDVELMSQLGVDSYRFSISWARIFPDGRGEINHGGVKYYSDLIDSLLLREIQPFVTLCHYDIPQALEDLYGGWLSPDIVDDFTRYAEACFRIFGGRVKYWSTFNEPNTFISEGYDTGRYPPGRCSAPSGICRVGNSSTEPYIAAHNVLSAHASAVHLYRTLYQPHQQGFIGIVMACPWFEPLRNNSEDIAAVKRALDFLEGWFLDPIVYGEYPPIMQKLVGTRLPSITPDLSKKLRGSYDFIGVNYYGARYVADASYYLNFSHRGYDQDSLAITTGERNGVPIGAQMWPPTLYGVPYGVRKILEYIKRQYLNPPIFITENGFGEVRNDSRSLSNIQNDTFRVDYIQSTLQYLARSMREGVDVRGYFIWSLLDNFEWTYGYTSMFGLYYVDFFNGSLTRYPKLSARWYRDFLHKANGKEFDVQSVQLPTIVTSHQELNAI